jgi:anti-anti-sigma factor
MRQTAYTRSREAGNGFPEHARDEAREATSLGQDTREAAGQGRGPMRARAAPVAGLEPFAVEVQWRDDVATVQPRGELDAATVETLRNALDDINGAGRLVLDLRGLSFIDSTGLHLLVALHQRAQREGFKLTLVAPAPPVDRAIQLCGLDASLPFVSPVDALDAEPGE